MRRRLAAIGGGCVLALGAAGAHAIDYRVNFNSAQPLAAQVEVVAPQRPDKKGSARIVSKAPLAARGDAIGIREQVSNVRCDGAAIKRNEIGWVLPPRGCARLAWAVSFDALGAQGVDASAQRNLYHAKSKSWLLSEPASLLRWPGSEGARIVIRGAAPVLGGMAAGQASGKPAAGATTLVMPDLADPPEFYFIGNTPVRRVRAGGGEFVYVRLADGELGPIEQAHADALSHFSALTKSSGPPAPALVAWLPIDEQHGGIGAASGGTSMLANVVVDRNLVAVERLPYSLAMLLQAQFHAQLAARPLAPWVNVSLSEYYTRKALARTTLDAATRAEIEKTYLPVDAVPSGTLIGFQLRIENNDAAAYRLLALEGSTFWLALDRAIQKESGGQRSLDDELPEILRSEFGSARMPVALVERLRAVAGAAAFNDLAARYLGAI